MLIHFFSLIKYLPTIVSICLLFPSIAMEEYNQMSKIKEMKTPLDLFQESPKYLVHIGFQNGLPEDGIMKPGASDVANYFSLNGTLPSNDYMPRLDTAPYVVIVKLTDVMMGRIIGFHVTEVLLAGKIDLNAEECAIIAPQGAKIPQALVHKIVAYEGGDLASRNQKTKEYLESLGAYLVCMEEKVSFNKRTWDNWTVANTTINGESININQDGSPVYFSNILRSLPNIVYTCPACAGSGIVHLSKLKGEIDRNNQEGIIYHQTEVINWVGTLTHLDDVAKNDFIARIQDLIENSKKDWISSTIDDIGDTENCIVS